LTDSATISVFALGGLTEGEHHIDVKMMLRIPYMAVPGRKREREYAVLDSCGSKTLLVRD
jgi:hypothetical protein